MDVVRKLGDQDAPHGTIGAAGTQHAGRGQHARAWHDTPKSSVLFSILLRNYTPTQLQSCSLRAACAVHRLLQEQFQIAAHIRWPNDILVQEKKICGILSEFRNQRIIIGVGLNCMQRHFPFAHATEATSLYLHKCTRRTTDTQPVLPHMPRRRIMPRKVRRRIMPPTLLPLLISTLIQEYSNENWHTYANTHLWRKGKMVRIMSHTPFHATVHAVGTDGALHYTRSIPDNDMPHHSTAVRSMRNSTQSIQRLYSGSIRPVHR